MSDGSAAVVEKSEAPVVSESFRSRVARRYDQWLKGGGIVDGIVQTYTPPEYQGDWHLVGPVEYYVHKLSVLGLKPSGDRVTEGDVEKSLFDYKDLLVADPGRQEVLNRAFVDFKMEAKKLGVNVGDFDIARIHLLSTIRIKEITGNEDFLALTIDKDGLTDTLIPVDESEVKHPPFLYDVVVHEYGHQARIDSKTDPEPVGGNALLEEGIIQAFARKVERSTNNVSRRTQEVYAFEAWVAESLAETLGVDSLFNMSHQQIRDLMSRQYSHLQIGAQTPYVLLQDDMERYLKLRAGIGLAEIQDQDRLSEELNRQRKLMAGLWGFRAPELFLA